MRNFKDLFWALAEFIDLAFESHSFNRISDILNVYHSFICQRMEYVTGLNRLLSSLLVSKNEINPFVKIFRYVVGLKCLSHDFEEKSWIAFCPWRQFDIFDSFFVLSDSKVQVENVSEERSI
jgi:hypothetical protein